MDTPEGDISAIQSGRMQPLPTYSIVDTSAHPLISAVDPLDTRHIPPTYQVEENSKPSGANDIYVLGGSDAGNSRESILPFPSQDTSNTNPGGEDEAWERQKVIYGFFAAIQNGQGDAVELFLTRNLVTANTVNIDGKTPLLAAVEIKNIKIVQQLLDAGAEPDAFGVVSKERNYHAYPSNTIAYTIIYRTPLQLASYVGHLPLVKLFFERYGCNDALIAPDGQIALRLASANNHREIVDYLPSRRGGGFLRWKTAHQRSLAKARRAVDKIVKFIKFFVWDIEKFFLWTCPKHLIVKPLTKGCTYCWENKKRWFDEFVAEVAKIPGRIANVAKWVWECIKKIPDVAKAGAKMAGNAGKTCLRGFKAVPSLVMKGVKATGRMAGAAGKACWKGIKKIPGLVVKSAKAVVEFIVDVLKWLWKLLTVELPRMVKALSVWVWKLLTVRVPRAIGITVKWIWEGLVAVVEALGNIFMRVFSLIHTILTAIVTFFANLSLTDILNGIGAILHAIFVALPKTIWSWIERFGDASFKVMKALFGTIGEVVWWVVMGIIWLVNYLPRKLWEVVSSFGESIGKGLHEIFVWFRPKA